MAIFFRGEGNNWDVDGSTRSPALLDGAMRAECGATETSQIGMETATTDWWGPRRPETAMPLAVPQRNVAYPPRTMYYPIISAFIRGAGGARLSGAQLLLITSDLTCAVCPGICNRLGAKVWVLVDVFSCSLCWCEIESRNLRFQCRRLSLSQPPPLSSGAFKFDDGLNCAGGSP